MTTTTDPVSTDDPAATDGANVNNSNSKGQEGGSNTNVVTAAIVVGTVVVAAAFGIWIFRKWKLSVSFLIKKKQTFFKTSRGSYSWDICHIFNVMSSLFLDPFFFLFPLNSHQEVSRKRSNQ